MQLTLLSLVLLWCCCELQDAVAAARAERNAAVAGGGAALRKGQRYFGGGKASPYEGLQPGAISEDLAQALGAFSVVVVGCRPATEAVCFTKAGNKCWDGRSASDYAAA
jgi:hypothetical protein